MPTITYGLIGIIAIISFIAFSNSSLLEKMMFWPYGVQKNKSWFKFITHGFVHANIGHLLFNMITLYFFGPYVEAYFSEYYGKAIGQTIYLLVYLLAIIISSIPAYFKHNTNSYYKSLGASGAVSAILFSSILISPLSTLIILPIPIPIPAWLFGPLYLGYSWYMAKKGTDNIGHDAHFMGAIFGLVATVALIPPTFALFLEQISTIF